MNKSSLLVALICALMAHSSFAETLNFASPGTPRSSMRAAVFDPWLDKIMEDSEGTLHIRSFYSSPLGNYRNMYDRVLDGVVDIAFTPLATVGGQFVQTDVASLPFEVENSLEGSLAIWNLYELGILAEEFEDIKLLGIFMFPNSALHIADRPIESMDDFNGIKMRTAGKMQSDTLALLGGTPVTAAIGDTYQGLNRGVFDGAIIPWTGVAPFKLDEVTHYHLNAPLGSSTAMIFMNQNTFDSLPIEAQRAIESNSGESLTQWAGAFSDEDAAAIEQRVAAQENQMVTNLSPEESQRWKQQLQPIIDEWVTNTPNGAEVLSAFRKEIELIRAAK